MLLASFFICVIFTLMPRGFPFLFLASCFLLLPAAFLTGCSSSSPEELDRLTKEDSSFKQMITARDQANVQIRAIKEDLLNRKKVMDSQVDRLRKEYDAYAKAQNLTIEKYRTTIEANHSLLKRDVEMADAELSAKLKELDGYQKTLSDVKKVLREGKGLALSAPERQKWEERVLMLSEKMRPLMEEVQDLKLKIRLKKQKMYFLR